MNIALKKTALFVRDLLRYDESLIMIGRGNEEITDFSIDYIAVDAIGPSTRLGSSKTYDGDAESMRYAQQFSAPVVLSFYGDGAWENATQFSALCVSQLAYDLQNEHQIAVYQTGGLTDVKILTGQQYGERVECNINVIYSVKADVETLRIDTAQISEVLYNE